MKQAPKSANKVVVTKCILPDSSEHSNVPFMEDNYPAVSVHYNHVSDTVKVWWEEIVCWNFDYNQVDSMYSMTHWYLPELQDCWASQYHTYSQGDYLQCENVAETLEGISTAYALSVADIFKILKITPLQDTLSDVIDPVIYELLFDLGILNPRSYYFGIEQKPLSEMWDSLHTVSIFPHPQYWSIMYNSDVANDNAGRYHWYYSNLYNLNEEYKPSGYLSQYSSFRNYYDTLTTGRCITSEQHENFKHEKGYAGEDLYYLRRDTEVAEEMTTKAFDAGCPTTFSPNNGVDTTLGIQREQIQNSIDDFSRLLEGVEICEEEMNEEWNENCLLVNSLTKNIMRKDWCEDNEQDIQSFFVSVRDIQWIEIGTMQWSNLNNLDLRSILNWRPEGTYFAIIDLMDSNGESRRESLMLTRK